MRLKEFKRKFAADMSLAVVKSAYEKFNNGTPVEKDALLSARTAGLQPLKYLMRLGVLKSYPASDFKEKEMHKCRAFLNAIKQQEDSDIKNLPEIVEKLLAWEAKAKSCLLGKEKQETANNKVSVKFAEIVGW